ncbi:MAG: hypothetical protein QOI13_1107 [Paraburkholderia sp.]|jgi:hypothetical protein|nr:hypothetical protein [Paraburkholderia sp.]
MARGVIRQEWQLRAARLAPSGPEGQRDLSAVQIVGRNALSPSSSVAATHVRFAIIIRGTNGAKCIWQAIGSQQVRSCSYP